MTDKFEKIKENWKEAKSGASGISGQDMLAVARKHHSHSRQAHLYNILILSAVCLMLVYFFYFVAPMRDLLSQFGIVLMIGGLIVRIGIEGYSRNKSAIIDYTINTAKSAESASAFYAWRRKIHGPVTITIITLYSIGFYLLTPEFMRYFEMKWIYLMDFGYLLIALILFTVIRKGVLEELSHLKKLVQLQENFHQ